MWGRLETGTTIGKYTILSELGRGGMGVVYLAEDTVLGRRVALKILPRALMTDDSFVKRFREEAKVIASLSHPNVVHVHTFEVIDDTPVIEMEFIEGGSLSRKLQREFVSANDIARYSHDIASALAYCHSLNAVHRDVKPSNILIDNLNHARLADFGIAKVLLDLEQSAFTQSSSGVFQGTPLYAPPEAWEGERPSTSWDIYGLGAVMYQGLTGAPPYEANTPLQLVKKIANAPVQPVKTINAAVSDDLAGLVDDMLRAIPEDRPDSAAEVCQRLQRTPEFDFDAARDTRTVAAPRAKRRRAQRTGRPAGNRPGLALAGIAVVAAVAIVGLVLRMNPPESPSKPDTVPPPVAQDTITTPRILDINTLTASSGVEEILGAWKDATGTRAVVFDTEYQSSPGRLPETWLVNLSDEGPPTVITAFGPAGISRIAVTPREGTKDLSATGDWASYLDSGASVFRHGSVTGTLRWRDEPLQLVGNLIFTSEQDGSLVSAAVSAIEHSEVMTDTRFLFALEESDYVQPLLFRELLPRELAWAQTIESLLPCFASGTVRAQRFNVEHKPIQLDGVLDDEAWTGAPPLEFVLAGVPRSLNSGMRFTYDETALWIAIELSGAEASANLSVDIHLMRTMTVPLSAASRLHLGYDAQTGEAKESLGAAGGTQQAGSCKFSLRFADGVWKAEAMLPFAAFGPNDRAPAKGERWRVNAVAFRLANGGGREAISRWGFPDETDVRHGAIIRFD